MKEEEADKPGSEVLMGLYVALFTFLPLHLNSAGLMEEGNERGGCDRSEGCKRL